MICLHIPLLQNPDYASWQYLTRNEFARDHGKRMFYTDETGETVPASDDEKEAQVPQHFLVFEFCNLSASRPGIVTQPVIKPKQHSNHNNSNKECNCCHVAGQHELDIALCMNTPTQFQDRGTRTINTFIEQH